MACTSGLPADLSNMPRNCYRPSSHPKQITSVRHTETTRSVVCVLRQGDREVTCLCGGRTCSVGVRSAIWVTTCKHRCRGMRPCAELARKIGYREARGVSEARQQGQLPGQTQTIQTGNTKAYLESTHDLVDALQGRSEARCSHLDQFVPHHHAGNLSPVHHTYTVTSPAISRRAGKHGPVVRCGTGCTHRRRLTDAHRTTLRTGTAAGASQRRPAPPALG